MPLGRSIKPVTTRQLNGRRNPLSSCPMGSVRADHWRIWSTLLLPTDSPGERKVEVVDKGGKILEVRSLAYWAVIGPVATK